MRTFDVQSIEIDAPFDRAFSFIAAAENLPEWASAFEWVSGGKARMRSPGGLTEIGLCVEASRDRGTIDWAMTFPDGVVAKAHSRLVELGPGACVYSFVLTAPPVPLEQIEGALAQQSGILAEELIRLRKLLESSSKGAP